MEAQKVAGIIHDNLDEIVQPISEAIILLRSLLEELIHDSHLEELFGRKVSVPTVPGL